MLKWTTNGEAKKPLIPIAVGGKNIASPRSSAKAGVDRTRVLRSGSGRPSIPGQPAGIHDIQLRADLPQWLVVVLALKYSAPLSVESLQTCIRKGSCTSDQRRLSLRVQRRFGTFYRRKRFRRPRFSQPHTDAILQYNPSPQSASSPLRRQRPSSACP